MEDLVEIERIKILKARYFRLLDCKLWDQWKECFMASLSFDADDYLDQLSPSY
ncbi:MAG: nuclear transport factor 2 family protein [Pseudomonadales bacterium]